ncbi:programmed cell death protein [Geranomyces variabilis]|uniref:Programmed cell death protein n=1 Tax=Geranomyces variabilis TaxID=109894 RepID=A0AAD5XI01_9FUNG|nr:programmed cell death protein [Geranomyces variabilis]
MTAAASDVQIGYPCDKIKFAQDTDPFLDKIGGTPVWLEKDVLPPAEWAACEACGKPLLLMLQLWAKLPEPGKASRVYYLFACNTRICMPRPGSWRVVKAIKRTAPASTPRNKKHKSKKTASAAAADGAPATPQQTPKKKGSTNKKTPSSVVVAALTPTKTPATPASASAFSWDQPSTPFQFGRPSPAAFGSPLVFGAPPPPSPSPSRSALELLAERDKKYAWDEDDDDDEDLEDEEEEEQDEEQDSLHPPRKGPLPLPRGAGISNSPSPSPSNTTAAKPSNTNVVGALTTQLSEALVLSNSAATDTVAPPASLSPPPPGTPATPASTTLSSSSSSSSSKKAAWSAAPTFPAYPLEFSVEWTDEDSYEHELRLLAEYNTKDAAAAEDVPADGVGGGWTGEGYEKSRPKYMNKAFKRFQKLVEEDPEQCIRYDLNGQPAFYSNDAVSAALTDAGPPACARCGGARTFEFQLMPMILSLLPIEQLVPRADKDKKKVKAASSAGGGAAAGGNAAAPAPPNFSAFLERHACGMDWGTVLVYSCAADCEAAPSVPSNNDGGTGVSVSYSLEYAAVQVESLM